MSEVCKKFQRCDQDGSGLISKMGFAKIVSELDLKLTPAMLKQYVDSNFRFVDRALQGRISFGCATSHLAKLWPPSGIRLVLRTDCALCRQFLACYANFLYSYEISQVRAAHAHAAHSAWL
jgi:hypothetical protein